ncbi:MAG: lysophospholipase [Bacteroidales bacterium]|nr:lysophospholipase [Bacteroidales bacterium]
MITSQTERHKNHSSPGIGFYLIFLAITSCIGETNPGRNLPASDENGSLVKVRDGSEIFVWEHRPADNPVNSIYILSGITGVNHEQEREIIDVLSNHKNRIVVIHPRGTGYSYGESGDTDPGDIIEDYCEIIRNDSAYLSCSKKIFLFGHSMSCAFALGVAVILPGIDGMILVNPPFKLKPAKGMSPGFFDYLKYIGYYVFAPHKPVVNMAGDPSLITDESDRLESELRNSDSLLVKYFSMHSMAASKKIMDAMSENARVADFPLLLLYGENDNIVDKSGCEEIFSAWHCDMKSYVIIKDGSHGRSTVVKGADTIAKWIGSLQAQ